uniref:Uncharacterized protein n=1 Tax=Gouania willdenowi TaxID=441366 RepID=A0A8C5EZD5_GOUWI
VFTIQPGSLDGAEEELGSVGVGSCIGHGQDSWSGVLQLEVLISKLLSIDGLTSGPIVVGEVAALAHEVRDDSMEGAPLVAKAFLSSAESSEVLRRLRHHVSTELHDNPADGVPTGGNVEEDSGLGHVHSQDGPEPKTQDGPEPKRQK